MRSTYIRIILRMCVHAYYMYGTTAKFKSANIYISAAWDQTAKFKDCQYLRLYGTWTGYKLWITGTGGQLSFPVLMQNGEGAWKI